jgi:hypothetical protein
MAQIAEFSACAKRKRGFPCLRFALVSCLLALVAPSVQAAVTIDDILINVESQPAGSSTHGYFEYVISVTNTSSDNAHEVTLILPRESHVMRRDYIRELRRSVQVGAGETVRVSLLQPDHPPIGGYDLAVAIDGRRHERDVQLRPSETNNRHGYSSFSYGPYPTSGVPAGGESLVLMSAGIRKAFPPSEAITGGMSGMGGMPGPGFAPVPAPPPKTPDKNPKGKPAPVIVPTTLPGQVQFVRADKPAEAWSPHWLAYSRYDGIVITGDELSAMPPAIQTALWQYVEIGGSLLVLGKARLPKSWQSKYEDEVKFTRYEAGFGECLVSDDGDVDRWSRARLRVLTVSWSQTRLPWQERRDSYEANHQFPIVDNIGIPVKGLFVLMVLFTLAIGPINFIVLARKKRRIWLLWTTPIISFVTCLAVFGYMLISEGWTGHLRTETLTLLDESSRRATTIGWTGVYSPLTPGDGLHFSYDTEVVAQRRDDGRRSGVRSCTLDWTNDQHFAQGWVEARVPAQFKVRKSETRRERVTIRREAGDQLTMVNGLGAEIRRFWYADERGLLHTAEGIAPGASAVLTTKNDETTEKPVETLRTFFGKNWLTEATNFTRNPRQRLTKRSYLAELDDSPFLKDALSNAKSRKCHALVLGKLSDNGEGE